MKGGGCMDLDGNIVRNLLFEFIMNDYEKNARRGFTPSPISDFHPWLEENLRNMGYGEMDIEMESQLIELTLLSLEDLKRDRVIADISGQESTADRYVPTPAGLSSWNNENKSCIIPSNFTYMLRKEIPVIEPEFETVFIYAGTAVQCLYAETYMAGLLCMATALECASDLFARSLEALESPGWKRKLNSLPIIRRIDLILEKVEEILQREELEKEYILLYPEPDRDFRRLAETFLHGLNRARDVICLIRDEKGTPTADLIEMNAILNFESLRELINGCHPFLSSALILREILENLGDLRKSARRVEKHKEERGKKIVQHGDQGKMRKSPKNKKNTTGKRS